jgi:hypothetical protein
MIWSLAILTFVTLFSQGLGQPESCFLPGECLLSVVVGGKLVRNEETCLELCKSTDGELNMIF